MLLSLLLACTGGGDDKNPDDTAGGTGLEDDCHPMYREYGLEDSYCYLWVHTCSKSSDDQAWILGEASTDANGNFEATETWFWLTDDDGPDDRDGYDVLEFTGKAMTRATIDALGASQSEEGYDTIRNVQSQQTDLRYGTDENILYVFDTLTPNGTLNMDNNMLVYRYRESQNGGWKSDVNYARGHFYPEDEANPVPPATYTWEGSICN